MAIGGSSEKTGTLVLDQGTHASRAILFDPLGRFLFARSQSIALHRFPDGRVEQDPEEILRSVRTVLSQALAEAKNQGITMNRVGLASQRSTVIAWHSETGEPLCPALSWQDTRARRWLARFHTRAELIQERTGLRLSPHYGASKLAWLLQHEPAVRQAVAHDTLLFGPLAAFLLCRLLEQNQSVVDVGNAARTLLLNIDTCDWDQELLTLFGISARCLPQCQPIRHEYGVLANTELTLSAANGDQPAILFAEGRPQMDLAYINMGSGAFILFPTGKSRLRHQRLLSGLADYDGVNRLYYLEGTVNGAGTALEWARGYCHAAAISQEPDTWFAAAPEPPVFINAIGGLGSPWWDPEAKAYFLDQRESACEQGPEACLAGVAESILFLLRANLDEALRAALTVKALRVSGGLARSNALCQRLADLSALAVLRSRQSEGTAAGMAWLAAGRSDPFRPIPVDSFQPQSNPKLHQRYRRFLAAMEQAYR